MNKKMLMINCFLILAILAGITYAAIPDAAQVKVTLVSQEPDPANPGDVIDLRFKIENTGSSPTGDILFEILPEYPFSVYKGNAQINIGSLQSQQKDETGIIVLYKIKVDENAVEREEKIDVRYRASDDTINPTWTYAKDCPIRIRTRDLVVGIESITSSPDPISPGKEALVTLKVVNNADSLVRDLKIKLDMSGDTIPFAPIKSTAEKSIYQLEARGIANFEFFVVAEPDAEGGIYKVPLTISYSDETGTSYSKEDILSLKIASKPDVLVIVDSTDIYSKQKSGKAVIKIVNRGLTGIKLLTAKLESNQDFDVLSQKEVYLGNIDSDDYETVEFKLDVKSKNDVINLPLQLTYLDSTNNEFKQNKDVALIMLSSSDAQKAGLTEKSSIGYLIIVIIVAGGIGIYFWRRRAKKAKRG